MQAGSVTGEIGGLQEWAWRSPREAEVDPSGWPEGVEAGPSEAWASRPADLPRHCPGETGDAPEELLQSKPADLVRHWSGETEDASEELLLTAQEPGEETGRPRVEAGHSEAWASKPADLARHKLGGTRRTRHQLRPGRARGRGERSSDQGSRPSGTSRFCQPKEPRVPRVRSRGTAHGSIEGGHRH